MLNLSRDLIFAKSCSLLLIVLKFFHQLIAVLLIIDYFDDFENIFNHVFPIVFLCLIILLGIFGVAINNYLICTIFLGLYLIITILTIIRNHFHVDPVSLFLDIFVFIIVSAYLHILQLNYLS